MRALDEILHKILWRGWLVFLVLAAMSGCGGQDDYVYTGLSPQTGSAVTSIRLVSELEATSRAVPGTVTSFRLTGYDAQGVVRYGPQVKDKATEVVFDGVPTSVVYVHVEYLIGDEVSGLAVVQVALLPEVEYVIRNLDFEDVQTALQKITITPLNPFISAGTNQQFTLTGTRAGGQQVDLTQNVEWTSSSTNVATITTDGLAHSKAPGQTEITASFGDLSVSTTLTVTDAVPVSLQVTPGTAEQPAGLEQKFKAEATLSDNSVQDVSDVAVWTSSDTAVAGMNGATAETLAKGTSTVTAEFKGLTASSKLTVTDAALASITITPTDPSLPKGTTAHLTATGTYSDHTSVEITDRVEWSADAPAVATVDTSGVVTAATLGSTDISAKLDGISGSTTVVVTDAVVTSVVVTPVNPSVPNGLDQQFTAVAYYSDTHNMEVTDMANWSSGDTSVATVGMTTGLASTVNEGHSEITATFGGKSGSSTLTVQPAILKSITVTPSDSSLAKGTNTNFQAVGTYSNGDMVNVTDSVSWSSSAPSIATVASTGTNKGLATAVSEGSTTITAAKDSVSGDTQLTVTAAVLSKLTITPTNPSIPDGLDQQFTAVATYSDMSTSNVTTQTSWTSSETSVANIGSATGLATGEGQGTTTISGSFGGKMATTELQVTSPTITGITVTPSTTSIPNGTDKQFTATASYSNGTSANVTNSADWTSSQTGVATIVTTGSIRGLATSHGEGSTTIAASFQGKTDSATLAVSPAVLSSISVTPVTATVADGLMQNFQAVATYSDMSTTEVTTQATWSSSQTEVATVGLNTGIATGQNAGTTTITANFGGKTDSASLTVTAATLESIEITPVDPSIAKGLKQQFTATGHYSNSTSSNITDSVDWDSSDTSVAGITTVGTGRGLATAVGEGSTTITATKGAKSATTTLTVTPVVLNSIVVSPSSSSVAAGSTQNFTATAHYSDMSTANVTTQADWSSSDTGVATIGLNTGVATGEATGSAVLTATFGGKSDSGNLEVVPAVLQTITVTTLSPMVAVGLQPQFTATGHYSNGSDVDVTNMASWSSSDTEVADISTTGSSRGLATTYKIGTTTITAAIGAVSGQTDLKTHQTVVVSEIGSFTQIVPAGATKVQITLVGGDGGYGGYKGSDAGVSEHSPGAHGETVIATRSVTVGSSIAGFVGGPGQDGARGTPNGTGMGGAGGMGSPNGAAGQDGVAGSYDSGGGGGGAGGTSTVSTFGLAAEGGTGGGGDTAFASPQAGSEGGHGAVNDNPGNFGIGGDGGVGVAGSGGNAYSPGPGSVTLTFY